MVRVTVGLAWPSQSATASTETPRDSSVINRYAGFDIDQPAPPFAHGAVGHRQLVRLTALCDQIINGKMVRTSPER